MEDIERLCKRILILRHGELVYDGPLATVADRHARHKVVTVHLGAPGAEGGPGGPSGAGGPARPRPDLAALGRVLAATETEIRLEVPRERVAEAAAALLAGYEVADLSIEEEDIGSIIESIIADRREAGTPG
jgi:ABC-2 type transport system ATP-binding protein